MPDLLAAAYIDGWRKGSTYTAGSVNAEIREQIRYASDDRIMAVLDAHARGVTTGIAVALSKTHPDLCDRVLAELDTARRRASLGLEG